MSNPPFAATAPKAAGAGDRDGSVAPMLVVARHAVGFLLAMVPLWWIHPVGNLWRWLGLILVVPIAAGFITALVALFLTSSSLNRPSRNFKALLWFFTVAMLLVAWGARQQRIAEASSHDVPSTGATSAVSTAPPGPTAAEKKFEFDAASAKPVEETPSSLPVQLGSDEDDRQWLRERGVGGNQDVPDVVAAANARLDLLNLTAAVRQKAHDDAAAWQFLWISKGGVNPPKALFHGYNYVLSQIEQSRMVCAPDPARDGGLTILSPSKSIVSPVCVRIL